MKNTLVNKLGSFKATLSVADRPEYSVLWQGKAPVAFENGLTELRPAVAALETSAAGQSVDITGDTAALKLLRAEVERQLHILARASYRTLLSLGRTEDSVKVDFARSDLRQARALTLAGMAETLLQIAEPLAKAGPTGAPAPGEAFGVTGTRVGDADTLWSRYSVAVAAPVSVRSTRKALTERLPGDFRDAEAKFSILDDLVLQFGESAKGKEFVNAWFNGRQVIDLGHRGTKEDLAATAPAPAAPASAPAA